MQTEVRGQRPKDRKYLLIIGLPMLVALPLWSVLKPSLPNSASSASVKSADLVVDMGEYRGGHLCPVQKISSTLKGNPQADVIRVVWLWRSRVLKTSDEFQHIYDRRRGTYHFKVTTYQSRGSKVTALTEDAIGFNNVTDKFIHAAAQKALFGQPLVRFLTDAGCQRITSNKRITPRSPTLAGKTAGQ